MWNSNGDFDGGYANGGGGDGGFMAGDSNFDSPGMKEQSKTRNRVQNLVPMTIKMIEQSGDDGLVVAGMEVNMAVVVGLIRAVNVTSTKVTYVLDDTTGTLDVVQWVDNDNAAEDGGGGSLMEYTYCRAAGTVRSQHGKKHLMAFKITPITDLNFITNHILSVMHAVLKIQQVQQLQVNGATGATTNATGGPSMSNSLVGASGLGGGMDQGSKGFAGNTHGLTPQQNFVYSAIYQCPDETGTARQSIYSTLAGKLSHKQIDDILEFLSSEGHIYSTIDEDHFKSTDG